MDQTFTEQVEFEETDEWPAEDRELARWVKQQLADAAARRDAKAEQVAIVLSEGLGVGGYKLIDGIVTDLVAVNQIGTPANRIAALRLLGQTLVNLADREEQYLSDAAARRQAATVWLSRIEDSYPGQPHENGGSHESRAA